MSEVLGGRGAEEGGGDGHWSDAAAEGLGNGGKRGERGVGDGRGRACERRCRSGGAIAGRRLVDTLGVEGQLGSWRGRRQADRYVDLLTGEVRNIKGEVLELHYAFKEDVLGGDEMLGGSQWEQGGGCIGLKGRLGVMDSVTVGGDALGTSVDARN